MRYRLALLMLFAALPMMPLLATPAPDPSGILELGPPPEGWTLEQYLKDQVKFKTSSSILARVCSDPEVKKLPSVAAMKDPRSWLEKNVRGTAEEGRCRLRITFRDGKRPEQVTIINAILRVNLALDKEFIKSHEEDIRLHEHLISKLEDHPTDTDLEVIHGLKANTIPLLRASIALLKQTKVIKWAE